MAGVGKGSTTGTHQFGCGSMGNPRGKSGGDRGEDGQRWVMAAAWHGKDQGAAECPPERDMGDGYRGCE